MGLIPNLVNTFPRVTYSFPICWACFVGLNLTNYTPLNPPIYLGSPMQTCCLSPLLCLKSDHHARDPFQLKRKKDTGQISSDFFWQCFKYFAIDRNIKVAATTSLNTHYSQKNHCNNYCNYFLTIMTLLHPWTSW